MEHLPSDRIALLQDLILQNRKTTFIHMRYLSRSREYAPGEELYMREAHLIMAIGLNGAATMALLAQKMETTQGAVSQIAARLEKKGYILRARSPDNWRVMTASLTEKGKALYEQHSQYDAGRYARISKCFEAFSDEELQLFARYEKLLQWIWEQANQEDTL